MLFSKSSDRRNAVSSAALAGIVVVVIAVAAVGAYLTIGSSPQASTSNTSAVSSSSTSQSTSSTSSASSSSSSSSSSSTSSTTSSSSSASSTTTSSTSSATSTTSTSSSTSSALAFDFVLESTPDPILVAPGSNSTYPQLTLSALPAASSGSETITLNATSPAGLTVAISPKTTKLDTGSKASVGITVNAGQSMAPGDYKVTITSTYAGVSKSTDIKVKVVQYLVLESGNVFNPSSLSVKQGSTVYWINLDGPSRFDVEIHNVVFQSGTTAKSPDMPQYGAFSYTFAAPGTYYYACAYHPGMKGIVTVTP